MEQMVTKKTCRICGNQLPLDDFNNSSKTLDGIASQCRACLNSRRRELKRSGMTRTRGNAQSTILATALRQGDLPSIQKILREGVAPRWDWICETMREGHLAVAEMLVASGVKRNVFTMAAMGDLRGLVRRLRQIGEDAQLTTAMEPASVLVTPLHVACASDWKRQGQNHMTIQVRVAMTLRDYGADLNGLAVYRGIVDVTPLLCACWSSENLALVQWFLDQGAQAADACLPAALGHLQRHKRAAYDIAEALVASGLSIESSKATGRTMLQAFAHQGDHRTVSWLIAHGADVNARNSTGRTAVHFAAERNASPKTLAVLVESGANLLDRDTDGRTPMEIAKLNEKTRIVEWIKERLSSRRR